MYVSDGTMGKVEVKVLPTVYFQCLTGHH